MNESDALIGFIHKISEEVNGNGGYRLVYQLHKHGIDTFSSLIQTPLQEIAKYEGVGPKTLEVVRVAKERLEKEGVPSNELYFTQEEKQLIWDALFHYQKKLYEESHSEHFAKDDFAKQYDICTNLMTEKLDKHWKIMH